MIFNFPTFKVSELKILAENKHAYHTIKEIP